MQINSLATPPSRRAKSKSILEECFYKGSLTDFYQCFPFGTTLQRCDQTTVKRPPLLSAGRRCPGNSLSVAGSRNGPARTSVQQEREPESKEAEADCGHIWQELLVKYDPDTHSWKTHHCLWEEDLLWSSVTLPKWGMMQGGVCLELMTWARHTSESDAGSEESWPTPCARDWKGANAVDGLTRNDGKSRMDQLPNAVAHGGTSTRQTFQTTKEKQKAGGQLNPDWVEWLMGWPIGWTACEPLATDKFQRWLNSHGKC